eukprot:XP_001704998.1 Hypothetical protein GL50803_112585 [Giardia lamblia ATCC 50803]
MVAQSHGYPCPQAVSGYYQLVRFGSMILLVVLEYRVNVLGDPECCFLHACMKSNPAFQFR